MVIAWFPSWLWLLARLLICTHTSHKKSEIATRADISLFYFFVSFFADHIANEQVYCEKNFERIYTKEEGEGGESEVL